MASGTWTAPGEVLKTLGRDRIDEAVVVDLIATGEAVPHVDRLDHVIEDDLPIGLGLVYAPRLDGTGRGLGSLGGA